MPQSNAVLDQLVDLNDLVLKRTRAVYAPLGPDYGITVHWSPDALDPKVFAGFQNLGELTDPFDIASLYIAPLVSRWELTSAGVSNPMKKAGADYPPTADNITALGLVMVQAIAKALNDDFVAAMNAEGFKQLKDESGDLS